MENFSLMEVPCIYTISCTLEKKYITEKNKAERSDGPVRRGTTGCSW
jgi:hypothetical protein